LKADLNKAVKNGEGKVEGRQLGERDPVPEEFDVLGKRHMGPNLLNTHFGNKRNGVEERKKGSRWGKEDRV
jgi:hypothetical protein